MAICQTLSGGMKSDDSKTFYMQVKQFKDMLRSKIKHLEKVPLMQTFPDNPFDIPQEVFNRVFPPDDQPVQECTASLGMSAGLPSRKSHGSVKEKRKQSFPETMSTAMGENPMMMQMMSMLQMMMMHREGTGPDSIGLEVFANKRAKKAPKAIMDKPAEEPGNDPGDNDAAERPQASTAGVDRSPPTTTPRQSAPQKTPGSAQSTPPAKQLFATSPEGTKSPEEYVADLQAALKSREKSKVQQKQDNKQDDEESGPVMKKPAAKAKSIPKKTEEDKGSKEGDIPSVKKTAAKTKAGAKSAPKASGKAKPKAAAKTAAAESVEPPKEGASELPNPPVPWNGTFFWLEGKVHRNPAATCWRVFIDKKDRNDKKVKFGDDEVASFHKALRLIEEGTALRKRAEVAENVD